MPREPAMMAEPEDAGDDKTEHQRDQAWSIEVIEVGPAGRSVELRVAWQVVGKQRHRNAEDGVGELLQPSHFEKIGMAVGHV